MKVLVTGHDGYIGSVLSLLFQEAGHEVWGLDSGLFRECGFGEEPATIPEMKLDLRQVQKEHLAGFEAIVHLAGISNDPVGDLNPQHTYDVNHRASVRLAQLAKEAGVSRYLFSSSCSLYGSAGEDFVDESTGFNPVTAYGESKILVEQDVAKIADDDFSPVFLRNATVYGVSPRLRADLVVNNLTGAAFLQGEALLNSDGTPWRPLVHVQDVSRVFLACLEGPRELVHNEAFNVGRTEENYQIREVAEIVSQTIPGSRVAYGPGASADIRDYRVDCSKLARTFPAAVPSWTVRQGVEELYEAYQRNGLTSDSFRARYVRIAHIKRLLEQGRIDDTLQWVAPVDMDELTREL